MSWAKPQYSKTQVDAAGVTLANFQQASQEEFNEALNIISNLRSSHSFPLNTFQMNLRQTSAKIDGNCLVAQRIKRLLSIYLKLS